MTETNSFPITLWRSSGRVLKGTVLWPLCCVTLLSGCGPDTRMAYRGPDIPAALFETGSPGVVADTAGATQADIAIAYPETAAAWETCAFNLKEVEAIISGMKSR